MKEVTAEDALIGERFIPEARREMPNRVVVLMCRQSELPEVVAALGPTGGLSRQLDCWENQAYQDRNDRDHNQQFDQRKATPPTADVGP